MSVARQLYQLQLLDSELDEKRERLAELIRSLGPSDAVRQAQEAASEAEKALAEVRSRARALDLEVKAVGSKLDANQERLYGGKVRNPKELSGLEEEARALRRRRAELEDQELELLVLMDEEKARLAGCQTSARRIEAEWRAEQATLDHEKSECEARLAELDQLRGELAAPVGRAALRMYEEMRASLGGIAVGLLSRGSCSVCGVDLPTGEAVAAQRGEGLCFCSNCGRLLCGGG